MRKILSALFLITLFLNTNYSLAASVDVKTDSSSAEYKTIKLTAPKYDNITREEAFIFVFRYAPKIPTSYKYIKLNYKNLDENTRIYNSLQKGVYLDVIANSKVDLALDKEISIYDFFVLIKKVTGEDLLVKNDTEKLKNLILNEYDLQRVRSYLELIEYTKKSAKKEEEKFDKYENYEIFKDVYNTLTKKFLWSEDLDGEDMFAEATKALVKASGDSHSDYLLAQGKTDLIDDLNNSFEGIGAYVRMETQGEVIITEPIEGGGADKAGLRSGDVIIDVDDKGIATFDDISEVTALMKGPAGTEVKLTIRRGVKIFDVVVTRAKIQFDNVEGKKVENKNHTYYIKMRAFGDNTLSGFKRQIKQIKNNPEIENIIFDLRGNPGGIVGQAEAILNYFVPEDEIIYTVHFKEVEEIARSSGIREDELEEYGIDFDEYKMYVLIDEYSASAAEMFAAGVKYYYPDTKIVGMPSYGKASMQTFREYKNGSVLKYTIAVWTIGEDNVEVHDVGITPDKEIEFDIEKYYDFDIDSQLGYVLDEVN